MQLPLETSTLEPYPLNSLLIKTEYSKKDTLIVKGLLRKLVCVIPNSEVQNHTNPYPVSSTGSITPAATTVSLKLLTSNLQMIAVIGEMPKDSYFLPLQKERISYCRVYLKDLRLW